MGDDRGAGLVFCHASLNLRSQPRHHPLHPLLPDVGVNLGGGDALVAEQRLDVHQFGPGVPARVAGDGVLTGWSMRAQRLAPRNGVFVSIPLIPSEYRTRKKPPRPRSGFSVSSTRRKPSLTPQSNALRPNRVPVLASPSIAATPSRQGEGGFHFPVTKPSNLVTIFCNPTMAYPRILQNRFTNGRL